MAIVPHVLNYFDTTGTAAEMDHAARQKARTRGRDRRRPRAGLRSANDVGFTPKDPERVGGLGGWAAGLRGISTPTGTALLLPKESEDVVLQIHYHRNAEAGEGSHEDRLVLREG